MKQVRQMLELMHAFEIRDLRRVTTLDQNLERGANQCVHSSTQHGLLTEQIGFALFAEGGFDDAGASGANGTGIRQTNILGVQNIIYAAIENKVERVIFTSSDKAVNPTNVMGTSKLMGERLITAANSNLRGDGPVFASTRFGNVLGSRGSVITIFRSQIRRGGPVAPS